MTDQTHASLNVGSPQLRRCTAAPCGSHGISVEVFDGTALDAVGWPSIEAGPATVMHVFQSREFIDLWMRTIGAARGAQPFLAVVYDRDGRAMLYVPLAIERRYNVSLLRFMDAGVSDFNAPVVATHAGLTQSQFAAAWTDILSQLPKIDVIDLQKISPSVAGHHNPLAYLACEPYRSSGYAIELSDLKSQVHGRASVLRMRRKLDRTFQRLVALGPTRFVSNPRGADAIRIAENLFRLKRDQYLRTIGSDLFAIPGIEHFYREAAGSAQLGRISHLAALVCNDTVVSAHLGFIGRRRFNYVVPAYDLRFRSLAPGLLLLDHLIATCAKDDYAVFDLGEGDFPYKLKWATHRIALSRYERPMTMLGRVYLETRRVRRRFTRHGDAMPAVAGQDKIC